MRAAGIVRENTECEEVKMSTEVIGIEKPVVIDRKQNLREHRLYWVGRRTQDVVLSALALVVLSPVMLATAIAIVVDDPSAGPVFSQERIGRDGKPFKFYKFRSMCPNAEAKLDDLLGQNEMDGPVFKIKDDPRITRVGKFIRKTSIDELPQLWNILKGDMSIVGPRPALPREVEQYGDYEKQRLYVTPGPTKPATVLKPVFSSSGSSSRSRKSLNSLIGSKPSTSQLPSSRSTISCLNSSS